MTRPNEKYQALLEKLERYQNALSNKKEQYLQSAGNAEIHSTAQDDAFGAAFILDFMMTSNQQLINYLYFLQNHSNSVVNQTLDKMMRLLEVEENQDIYRLLSSINDQINDQIKLIHKQSNYYMWRAILSFSSAMMLAGGGAALIILAHPVGIMIFAALAVALAVGVISGLVAADAINSEKKYHEYDGIARDSVNCLDKDTRDYNKRLEINNTERRYWACRSFEKSKEKLRGNFFSEKFSSESLTLADEVRAEFDSIEPQSLSSSPDIKV